MKRRTKQRLLLEALRQGPKSSDELLSLTRYRSRAALHNAISRLRDRGVRVSREHRYRLKSTREG